MKTEKTWSVELEQRVNGSPELVFEYFTDPEKYRRWQGIDVDIDPRPGGHFKVTTTPGIRAMGEYIAVEPPHRIVLTWGFESSGPPLPRGLAEVPPGSSLVEMDFVPDGDETVIRVRHTGFPSEAARWAHEQGWHVYLPRLEALSHGDDPGDDPTMLLAASLFQRDAEQSSE